MSQFAESTIAATIFVIKQNDDARLRDWLARHPPGDVLERYARARIEGLEVGSLGEDIPQMDDGWDDVARPAPLRDLTDVPVSEWTESEGYLHLQNTFDGAAAQYPDIMERHVVRLVEASELPDKIAIMRLGLRETFRLRYPPSMILDHNRTLH